MFSARAFVGWYNGLPENREVSLGSIPSASSALPLSQHEGSPWTPEVWEEKATIQAWEAPSELTCETLGWRRRGGREVNRGRPLGRGGLGRGGGRPSWGSLRAVEQ